MLSRVWGRAGWRQQASPLCPAPGTTSACLSYIVPPACNAPKTQRHCLVKVVTARMRLVLYSHPCLCWFGQQLHPEPDEGRDDTYMPVRTPAAASPSPRSRRDPARNRAVGPARPARRDGRGFPRRCRAMRARQSCPPVGELASSRSASLISGCFAATIACGKQRRMIDGAADTAGAPRTPPRRFDAPAPFRYTAHVRGVAQPG